MSREIEDGMGFSGLVPTAAERRAEAAETALIERLNKAHMVTVNQQAAEIAEWRGLYEHGLEDRNALLTRVQALEVALREMVAWFRSRSGSPEGMLRVSRAEDALRASTLETGAEHG